MIGQDKEGKFKRFAENLVDEKPIYSQANAVNRADYDTLRDNHCLNILREKINNSTHTRLDGFRFLGRDSDGAITMKDFREGLRWFNIPVGDEQAGILFNAIGRSKCLSCLV